jgi:deoxycytidylate deaminase
MAPEASKKSSAHATTTTAPKQLDLRARESAELVIGFSGAIGSGLAQVVGDTKTTLEEAGYIVNVVKISTIIERLGRELGLIAGDIEPSNEYETLQTAGNELRKKFSNAFLAEVAISIIAASRAEKLPEGKDVTAVDPPKVAYIVTQLKHPDEATLLRKIYGNLFYLVGVFAETSQRRKNLLQTLDAVVAERAMDRDRREEEDHGQQLDKTLKLADLFLRNNDENKASTVRQIQRFAKLIHGAVAITPTSNEHAMYAAYAASMRSACLSRQVGAAIADSAGNLVSTGCNDVPRFGGGLYSADQGDNDHRCVNWKGRQCWNDEHKKRIEAEIAEILSSQELAEHLHSSGHRDFRQIDKSIALEISGQIARQTRLRDLIEFSRAVHAEMEAILAIARVGSRSLAEATLFSTTFPCHSCARHIVASGIATVYYIEPYEKSLALDLHSDAIVGDSAEAGASESRKVRFLHFEGIAPRQYQKLFVSVEERKVGGKARQWNWELSRRSDPQFLDNYRELETRVVADLHQKGLTPTQLAKVI